MMSLAPPPRVLVLVLLPIAAPVLADQQASPLQPGARVRLTVPCDSLSPSSSVAQEAECHVEGRIDRLREDAITLNRAGSVARHPLSSVSRIEVSRGERSHWLAGAGAGFVIGAAGTYLALDRGGSTNPCDPSANQDAIGQGSCVALAVLGGAAGAGLGALVGSLFRSERWETVPADRWRVSLGPNPARFRVSVTLAF